MKTLITEKYGRHSSRLALGLLLLLGPPCYGFRADDEARSQKAPTLEQPKPAAVREVSVEQRRAAQLGEAEGLQVQWHPRLGTPIFIRGPALAQRRAYSAGKGLVASSGTNFPQQAFAVLDNLSGFYRLRDAESEFALKRVDADNLGFRHVRFAQMHQSLRVVGGDLTVHFDKSGQAYQVSGQYIPDVQLSTVPKIDPDAASRLAQQDLTALSQPSGTLTAPPVLVVYARESEPRLAYELTLRTANPKTGPGLWRYWLDAQAGTVLLRYNDVQKIAPPTANGTNALLNGKLLPGEGGQSVNLLGWQEHTGVYYLHNTNQPWQVYNVAPKGYVDTNSHAYRSSANWRDSDPIELSLGYNFDLAQRYYSTVHGRASFDAAGGSARANVHVRDSFGGAFVNAFWDPFVQEFFFGDGDAATANALGVLDVSAHEFTHAVTERTAGLIYFGETGALNESFSDVFGACVEFHAQGDGRGLYPARAAGTADWLIGEDAWLSSVALRDMRNPRNPATVGGGNEQPSRYQGSQWYSGSGDNGGVHQNSGVQNFFFYLLCEGGNGNNDGIAYNVTGIGLTNAEQVAYRALTVYCTPETDYQAARAAWLAAALDLNPEWAARVSAAWTAVGVAALRVFPEEALVFRGPVGGPFRPATRTYTLFNYGTEPLTWAVSSSQDWRMVTPTNGTVPPNGSMAVNVSVNAAAAAGLAPGSYTRELNFVGSESATRQARLLVAQPDYFSEQFSAGDNDLAYQRWTFTPNGNADSYSVCREVATGFLTDPIPQSGTVSLADDDFDPVTLTGTNTVALYGRRTKTFYIGSNGYLTWDSGDTAMTESSANHFSQPRISACFDDLNPDAGGTVTWKETSELVAVTFSDVPEYGSSATVNFQIELFFDGRIRLTCLGIGVSGGLAGLSAGGGVPPGFEESDFSSYAICPIPDDLVITPDGGLTVLGNEGGPFAPPNKVYTLRNVGTNSMNWSATVTASWLNLSSTSGSLAPGASNNLSVALNPQANALTSGLHTATLTVSNLATGFRHSRNLSLQIATVSGGIVVLDSLPPATDLQMPFGNVVVGLARTERLTVTNADPAHSLILSNLSLRTGLYAEDFNDGLAQGWRPDLAANWQVLDGEYRAQADDDELMTTRYDGQEWTDLTVQVTCRRIGSQFNSASLVLRATEDFENSGGSGYFFQIATDGQYSIWRRLQGAPYLLQTWTPSPAIRFGINTLTAVAEGASLRFYINGILVWTGYDTSLSRGRIALMGFSYFDERTTHIFDDVIVGKPMGGEATVSAAQQWYNQHAAAGGQPNRAPKSVRPALPQGFDSPFLLGVVGLQLLKMPDAWRLENLPTLPYLIPPGGAITFDATSAPQTQGSNAAVLVIESNDADQSRVEVQMTVVGNPVQLVMSPENGIVFQGVPGGPFAPSSASYLLSNAGPAAITWSLTHTQAWLDVAPSQGTLASRQSVAVAVSLMPIADLLADGQYVDTLILSNQANGAVQTRAVSLNVAADWFTKFFNASDPDLDFQSWTFTPDGSASFYAACREVATSFPTDPAGGTEVSLDDDDFIPVTLAGTNTVAIYHRRTNVFFIGSNGYLTLNRGDGEYIVSRERHFDRPRVSAFFSDLNPGSGGTVSWKETSELVAVTFTEVPEIGLSAPVNSFQIEMFFDGRIRLTYLAIGSSFALVGLSAGQRIPAGFEESDFASYGSCRPLDDLVLTPEGGLSAQGYAGGPFAPPGKVYSVFNRGTNALNWSVAATAPWLEVASTGVSLAPGVTQHLAISFSTQANALTSGLYTAAMTVSNLNSGFRRSRGVSVLVSPVPGELLVLDSISPGADLQMPFGDVVASLSRTEHLTLANTDLTHSLIVSNVALRELYLENFNDGLAQDWVPENPAHWQVVGGEYRAQTSVREASLQSLYAGRTWQDCTAQVVMRRSGDLGSAARLLLRATDDFRESAGGSAYMIGISGSGSYYVGKQVEGTFRFVQSWTQSTYLNPGDATNTVRASIQGTTLRVYLNGNLVWSGNDASLSTAGRAGLWGYSGFEGETIHYFDEFVVEALSGGGGAFSLAGVPAAPFTVAPGATLTFDVTCAPRTLGSNDASLIIACNDADEPQVEVHLRGQGIGDYLRVSPEGSFLSLGALGGPFLPASTDYTLSNTATGTLNWTAQATQSWLTLSPAAGSLAGGTATNVHLLLNANSQSLGLGTHFAAVTFSNALTAVTQMRPVQLTIAEPALSIGDAAVAEGNAANLVFQVSLLPSSTQSVTVAFGTTDGSALAGSDYVATNGLLQFAPGQTNQTFAVRVLEDTVAEPDETFSVRLTNALHAPLARATATGTILLNDVGPFADDFDPGIDLLQWSAFGGQVGSTVLATNYGGAVSGPNALWFGADTTRYAASRALVLSQGGVLDFWLRLGSNGSSPWETPDLPQEGVALEYSVDGGVDWSEVARYTNSVYRAWTHEALDLPPGAQTANTQLRWRQLSHSGIGSDHWALDDVGLSNCPCPPRIVAAPSDQTVPVGYAASFAVRAVGNGPLHYFWQRDGATIQQSTNLTIQLENCQLADSGRQFSCLVSNAYGTALSAPATLLVATGLVAVGVFADPRYVDLGDNPDNEAGNVQASLTNRGFFVVTFTNLLAASQPSPPVLLFPKPERASLGPALTGEERFALSNFVAGGGTMIVQGWQANELLNAVFGLALARWDGFAIVPWARTVDALGTEFADDPDTLTYNSACTPLRSGSLPSGARRIYEHETSDQCVVAELAFGAGQVIYLAWDWYDAAPRGAQDAGWLDVLESAVREQGPDAQSPPLIAAPPASQTVPVGYAATFCVSAGSAWPLSYFWRRDGVPIAGATQSCYTQTNCQLADSGRQFSCLVSNAYGTRLSAGATLTVVTGLVAVAVFDDARFVDTGDALFDLAEADNVQASLTNRGFFVTTFTNLLEALSQLSTLNPQPTFLFPEQEVTPLAPALTAADRAGLSNFVAGGGTMIVQGSRGARAGGLVNAVFGWTLAESAHDGSGPAPARSAAASGTEFADDPPSLPWHNACSALVSASLPFGARSIYETNGQSLVAEMYFGTGKIIFLGWDWYDAAPRGSRDEGWLDVLESAVRERGPVGAMPPVIVSQPRDQTVGRGDTATFSVGAVGSAPLSYFWRRDGASIAEATEATYMRTDSRLADSGRQFSCLVSNAYGTVLSTNATLTVLRVLTLPFAAPGQITIPHFGAATPYPLTNLVAGLSGTVTNVTVTLSNLSHFYPDDLDILLVGPRGQAVMLMSDAGGGYSLANVTLTFDSAAASALPDSTPITSGNWQPTDAAPDDAFAAPAPTGPYGTNLAVFRGLDPNGVWRLFIYDDEAYDSGTIAEGWELRLTTVATPAAPVFLPPQLVVNNLQLRFATTPGHTYEIQYKNSLDEPVWQSLQTVKGDLAVQMVQDAIGGLPQRFYRLRVTRPFLETDGLVVMEAEHFTATNAAAGHAWEMRTDRAGFVGEAAMQALPNTGASITANVTNSSPALSYQVEFTTTGTYNFWIRGWAASGSDDSVYLGVDGQVLQTLNYSQNGSWVWRSRQIVITNAGPHEINVWMREDGAYVDRLLLSTNLTFTPSGDGPPESPGSD